MPTDTTNPMIFIPELVLEFMSYLTQKPEDIHSAELVCKVWRGVALDIRWRSTYLRPLLSMLAPIGISKANRWVFKHTPQQIDWDRFHDVAQRVIILQTGEMCQLGDHLRKVLCKPPPGTSPALLSKLRLLETLETSPSCVKSIMFMIPSTLKRLKIVSPWMPDHTMQLNLLMDTPSRCPNISHLSLSGLRNNEELFDALSLMLPSLDALRSIDFSAQRLSPTILSVIGQLPSLEILGLWIQYPAYLRLARNFTLSNVTGVFPKLIELDIRSSFDETFASLLTNIITNCTHTLTNLSLHHRMDTEHKANIRAVVKAVAIQKRLTYLILADVLVDVLEVDILEPLGLCTELEWLRIEISAFTLAVAEERVGKLIRRLPYLKDLYVRLGERPGRWADGWTPLCTIVFDNKRLSIPNWDLRE